MMKEFKNFWEFLVEWVIKPIIAFLITSLLPVLYFWIKEGNIQSAILSIPNWIWFTLLIIGILLYSIYYRISVINKSFVRTCSSISYIPASKELLDSVTFESVLWQRFIERDLLGVSKIVISKEPYCPKCKTILKHKNLESFFGYYKWECVNCGFKIRKKKTFLETKKDLELISNGLSENEECIDESD